MPFILIFAKWHGNSWLFYFILFFGLCLAAGLLVVQQNAGPLHQLLQAEATPVDGFQDAHKVLAGRPACQVGLDVQGAGSTCHVQKPPQVLLHGRPDVQRLHVGSSCALILLRRKIFSNITCKVKKYCNKIYRITFMI